MTSVLIATILRRQGCTGIQSSLNSVHIFLSGSGIKTDIITAFSAPKWLVLPLFSLKKVISLINSEHALNWYIWTHMLALRVALAKAAALQPDVIYTSCPFSAMVALQVRQDKTKVVMKAGLNISFALEAVSKGEITRESQAYKSILDLEQKVFQMVDKVVYVSEFIKKQLEERHPSLLRKQTAVIPNFHYPARYQSVAPTVDIISIGSLEPRKNHAALLKILAIANKLGHTFRAVIIGDGPNRKILKDLAFSLGVHQQVSFWGYQPGAAQYLKMAKVYCHTAVMESFGIALIEALAAGLPVVAPKVGGMAEIVRHGKNGIFWDPGDLSQSANDLISLLKDDALLQRMSCQAKETFRDCYSPEVVGGKLKDFLLNNPSAHPYSPELQMADSHG